MEVGQEFATSPWRVQVTSPWLASCVCVIVLMIPRLAGAQPPSAGQEPMKSATVGTRLVAYHLFGEDSPGTPLVLINGGPGFDHSFLHMSTVWEGLAATRPVVFFDQPGTGQSWPVGAQDSLAVDDVLQSIEAVRIALNASHLSLLGHSWGGYVALAYAVRYSERVERLVLVSSVAPRIAATEFLFGALFPDVVANEKALSADNPEHVQLWVRGRLWSSFYSPEVRDRVLATLGRVPYNGRQETLLWRDAESRDLTNDLSRLTTPVLILAGRFDANVAPRTAWSIHRAIPSSRLLVFERSGHFPFIEEPELFFTAVDDFLRGR